MLTCSGPGSLLKLDHGYGLLSECRTAWGERGVVFICRLWSLGGVYVGACMVMLPLHIACLFDCSVSVCVCVCVCAVSYTHLTLPTRR